MTDALKLTCADRSGGRQASAASGPSSATDSGWRPVGQSWPAAFDLLDHGDCALLSDHGVADLRSREAPFFVQRSGAARGLEQLLSKFDVEDAPTAVQMLALSFGSLADAVMSAGPERISNEKTLETLVFLRALICDLFSEPLPPRTPLPPRKEFDARLKSKFAFEITERLDAIFLDGNCALLAEETMWTGTVDETPLFPRELAKRALALGAVHLILVHNHRVDVRQRR